MDNVISLEKYKIMHELKEMSNTMSQDTDDHLIKFYTDTCDEFTSVMYQIENFKIRKPEDFDILDNLIKFFMDNVLFLFSLEEEIIKRQIKTNGECEVGRLCHSFMDKIVVLKNKAYEEAKKYFNIDK